MLYYYPQASLMVPRHPLQRPKRTYITEESQTPSMKADVCLTAHDRTSTSAMLTSQSSARTSSATWRLSTCTSSTSTCLRAAMPEPLQTGRAPAPTPRPTAAGPPGAAGCPWLPRRPARAKPASTELTLKLSSWARATTASTHPSMAFTALTGPRPPPPRSPALSVTIQTFRAPATTAHMPATHPASTSTHTSIPLGDHTGATSSMACPSHPPTVPPPAGISRFTPRYPGRETRPLCAASHTIMKDGRRDFAK